MNEQKYEPRLWTEQERELLREWYGKLPTKTISKNLERSEDSVHKQAAKLGLKIAPPQKRWTKAGIAFVKKHYNEKSNEELAKALGVTSYAIETLLRRLKLRRNIQHQWTTQEKIILKRMYGKMPNSKLAKRLGVTKYSLEAAARRLGLSKYVPPLYSKEEIEFVKANYHTMRHRDLAEKMGRTVDSIENLARRRGWMKKNPNICKPFTEQEDEFIISNAGKMTQKEMSVCLGRTENSVNGRVQRLRRNKNL